MDKLICKHQEKPSEYAIKFMCLKAHEVVNKKICEKCKEKEDE